VLYILVMINMDGKVFCGFFVILLLVSGLLAQVSALEESSFSGYNVDSYSSKNNIQLTSPGSLRTGNSATFDSQSCGDLRTDFILTIPPLGCTPNVVRSDLLAEQNVPVFCKLSSLNTNPLIDVSSIKSISFSGSYPTGVSGVSYHPPKDGVKNYNTVLSSSYQDDAGYVVITLNRHADERTLPSFIEGDLVARINYDGKHLSGSGLNEYYVEAGEKKTSFWNGLGFFEVVDINDKGANINIYSKREGEAYKRFSLSEGELSEQIFFSGHSCSSGFRVRLNKIVVPDDMALLNVEGDKIWVRKGSKFLDDKCFVRDLNVNSGNTGTIDISCAGGNILLKLGGKGVVLDNGDGAREYSVGERIVVNSGEVYYIAYHGPDLNKDNFVLLSKRELSEGDLSFVDSFFNGKDWSRYGILEFQSSLSSDNLGREKMGELNKDHFFLYSGDSYSGVRFIDSKMDYDNTDRYNVGYELQKGEMAVRELIDFYSNEEKMNGVFWGEEALFEQIVLSGRVGYLDNQMRLISMFKEKYPQSSFLESVLLIERNNNLYDYSSAHNSVKINNEHFSIVVESFMAEKDFGKSATVKISGRSLDVLSEGEKIELSGGENLTVEKIEVNGVLFRFRNLDDSFTRFVESGKESNIGGYVVEVRGVNVRKVAYLSIIPEVSKTYSETPLSFKIGIEKRSIQLSPEMARNAIVALENTILLWESVLEKLASVLKVWKASCFATSTILMMQNMASGFDGASLSRNKVMTQYRAICDLEISRGNYKTRTECYNAISANINSDVSKMNSAINSVNSELGSVQEGNIGSSGIGGREIVDQDKYVSDLKGRLSWDGIVIDGVEVKKEDLTKSTEISSVMLYKKLGCSVDERTCSENLEQNVVCCSAYEEMVSRLKSAAIQKKATIDGERINSNIRGIVGGRDNPVVLNVNSFDVKTLSWSGQFGRSFDKMPEGIKGDDKVQFLSLNGKTFLLKLKDSVLGGSMGVEKAFILDRNNNWIVSSLSDEGLDKFVFVGGGVSGVCFGNVIKNPQIRYYESGSNKGLPAIVPFDLKNGWYVYVPNSIGGRASSTDSFEVQSFYICNVGRNGIIEQNSGDDLCQSFSINQMSYDSFISCGLDNREVGLLYSKARDAITKASRAYGGKGYVDISGNNVLMGEPFSDSGSVECQDFMSPEDCKLLFNVCDPVICPPSRCDMGGKYPVSDVVSTGIVGSILLCLPNAREGIVFPVCLTGVHAGVDAFVSILRSQKECLEHNLESGEYVGICDEITAIYMCEFFWRQFGPLSDSLLPTFLEDLFGTSGARGGGEYLNVGGAWDNLGRSVDYFSGFYAENAFSSFGSMSSQNVGIEICNGFLGTSVPFGMDAEGWNAILAPESPVQFYAHFSETPYTSATSPATSHYKVYYHIYAGNDFGASYQVYLKSPQTGGYYSNSPVYSVKTGFIARGDSADEAIDFTASAGYKELCVRINNEEHCGFGSVSTDFSVNYASEMYLRDEVDMNSISSEEDCLSTSGSSFNTGGEDINLAGITRVCATARPSSELISDEKGVVCNSDGDCDRDYFCKIVGDSAVGNCVSERGVGQDVGSRWVDVGHCGDANVRCYLDTYSLKDRFRAFDAVNSQIDGDSVGVVDSIKYGESFNEVRENYELARQILSESSSRISRLNSGQLLGGDLDSEISSIFSKLDEVIGVYGSGVGTSNNKAEALVLKSSLYRMIVEEKIKSNPDVFSSGPVVTDFRALERDSNVISDDYFGDEEIDESTYVEEGLFSIVLVNEKKYIAMGNFVSDYYFKENDDRVLILRENPSLGLPEIVGSVLEDERIYISQDRDVLVGDLKLGELAQFYYSKDKGIYEV
jgi:hypothetical protein